MTFSEKNNMVRVEPPAVEERDLPLALREVEEGVLFVQEREIVAGAIAGMAFLLLVGDFFFVQVAGLTLSSVWPPNEGSEDVLVLWALLGWQLVVLAVLKQLCSFTSARRLGRRGVPTVWWWVAQENVRIVKCRCAES